MKKRSIIGLSALAFSIFLLASCGGSNSSKSNETSKTSVVTLESTSKTSEATKTSSVAKTSAQDKTSEAAKESSADTSVATSYVNKEYNFTCNTISGITGYAKVTDNDGAQYNYISGTTFTLYEYSDGITFEYTNTNTFNVKATASVNGVVKASAVIGAVNNKNMVPFTLLASDITGDVVVNFEETTEIPVYCVRLEKNNANLSYSYKFTGTSVEDKAVESEFKIEEGYENLVITVQNLSSYEYCITVYINDNYYTEIESLGANATEDMAIPFTNITNDLVIKYEVVE